MMSLTSPTAPGINFNPTDSTASTPCDPMPPHIRVETPSDFKYGAKS